MFLAFRNEIIIEIPRIYRQIEKRQDETKQCPSDTDLEN